MVPIPERVVAQMCAHDQAAVVAWWDALAAVDAAALVGAWEEVRPERVWPICDTIRMIPSRRWSRFRRYDPDNDHADVYPLMVRSLSGQRRARRFR
ncbi:MAG: hypothetical protein ACI8RZ_000129 [Myxococcota bacterium]|jgi:hypothetical protein